MDLYDVLGVAQTATHSELRRGYLKMARRYHPDYYGGADAQRRRWAEDRMRSVNAAWAVLGDPARRRAYDEHRTLTAKRPGPSASTSSTGGGASSGAPGAASERPASPGAGGGARTASAAGSGSAGKDWRHYSAPGPATSRGHGYRLVAVAPIALLGTSIVLLALGLLMVSPGLVVVSALSAVAAAFAFVGAPLLAMREARSAAPGRRRAPERRSGAATAERGRARGARPAPPAS